MNICYTFSLNYERFAFVSLLSILKLNENTNLKIHLVGEVSSLGKNYLKELSTKYSFDYEIYEFKVNTKNFSSYDFEKKIGFNKHFAYARLFLADILPKKVKKILYIDCDTVVLRSLHDLYNIDIAKFPLAAVEDYGSEHYKKKYSLNKYFNSGVLLINLDHWRLFECSRHLTNFLNVEKNYLDFGDQCALNIFFKNKILEVDSRWNNQIFDGHKNKTPINNSSVLHWIGPSKPWKSWFLTESKSYFWNMNKETPWSKESPILPKTNFENLLSARNLFKKGHFLDSLTIYRQQIISLNKSKKLNLDFFLEIESNLNLDVKKKIIYYDKILSSNI